MWPIALSGRLPVAGTVGLSPRRLPDGPRPHPRAVSALPARPMRGGRRHPVLASVSRGCPGARGQVGHVLLTRSPLSCHARRRSSPFDLHVLGTPPAFILSQDQTLRSNGPSRGRLLFGCLVLVLLEIVRFAASPARLGRAAAGSVWLVRSILASFPQYPVFKVPAGPLGPCPRPLSARRARRHVTFPSPSRQALFSDFREKIFGGGSVLDEANTPSTSGFVRSPSNAACL